jgi:predicted transcriptional regulator
MAIKVTYTLDDETVAQIDRAAARLGMSRSRVVREAVSEYARQIGNLTEAEQKRLLQVFDEVTARIPSRPEADVDRELAAIRATRRRGGRRTRPSLP